MIKLVKIAAFLIAVLTPQLSLAQSSFWVQVEAQPNLRKAQERARAYAGAFEDVNGFAIGSGWYAIAMGPYTEDIAQLRLRALRRENLVPRDSYIASTGDFRQQFWPIGGSALRQPSLTTTPTLSEPTAPVVPVVIADETPRQARQSESKLKRSEKRELQSALKWEGVYTAGIDGSFGAGTRRAMEAYQISIGAPATGVLTTKQRDTLMSAYQAEVTALGLTQVIDDTALIQIDLPMGEVEFDRYEAPFAHYASKNKNSAAHVLLISEPGDSNTLAGLYDIMQTLDIVPLEGERKLSRNSFVLSGSNDRLQSYTYARHSEGVIKGYTLIWPTNESRRKDKILETMKASFTPFGDAAMSPTRGARNSDQAVDLLAGLEIRKPTLSHSGFYIDNKGTVLTTAAIVGACEQVTLDQTYLAEISSVNEALGIAILKPKERISPIAYAAFDLTPPQLKSEIAVAGYSYQGLLGAPTVTYGTLDDLRGLAGETGQQRLALNALPGDFGGPVFDTGGAVVGILLPQPDLGARKLPPEVSFAAKSGAINQALTANGVKLSQARGISGQMDPIDLSGLAADMTVLVSCWN
ncbi:MAG: serine protease [Pseudoruegeria sp.]